MKTSKVTRSAFTRPSTKGRDGAGPFTPRNHLARALHDAYEAQSLTCSVRIIPYPDGPALRVHSDVLRTHSEYYRAMLEYETRRAGRDTDDPVTVVSPLEFDLCEVLGHPGACLTTPAIATDKPPVTAEPIVEPAEADMDTLRLRARVALERTFDSIYGVLRHRTPDSLAAMDQLVVMDYLNIPASKIRMHWEFCELVSEYRDALELFSAFNALPAVEAMLAGYVRKLTAHASRKLDGNWVSGHLLYNSVAQQAVLYAEALKHADAYKAAHLCAVWGRACSDNECARDNRVYRALGDACRAHHERRSFDRPMSQEVIEARYPWAAFLRPVYAEPLSGDALAHEALTETPEERRYTLARARLTSALRAILDEARYSSVYASSPLCTGAIAVIITLMEKCERRNWGDDLLDLCFSDLIKKPEYDRVCQMYQDGMGNMYKSYGEMRLAWVISSE